MEGASHTVRFGRIGTGGQAQTKEFSSEAEAKKSYDKLIAEKVRMGYVEVGGATIASGGGAQCRSRPSRPKLQKQRRASRR